MNNKELINAGHELAKAISADTPIIEIAKMVTRLATALDVQQARANALAAENAGLKESHTYTGLSPKYGQSAMMDMKKPFIDKLLHGSEYYSVCGHISAATNRAISAVHGDYSWMPKTPATDAFLAEVRASALDDFAQAQDEQAKKYYERSPGCSGQNECQFAAGQAWYYAECIRKGVQS